ncbi:5694_t:CDS:2 [Scutellospora calospora]|uniref:5694_t:CDS:1 n=1 Tax=Scutellospora calospora TaxID=85575 RepID=A0ACA9MGG5_9GLOM|nr:5694_t:CDS:2 [Scutellospora calospora]
MENTSDIKTWDSMMFDFTNAISKDTECTELITILIRMLFSNNELGIFDLLPERSKDVVKMDDVKKELKIRHNAIVKIKQNLINYQNARKSDRSIYMTNLIKLCDDFYNALITGRNNDNVCLLTIAITFAFIHLTILRERNRHSKEIYLTKQPNKTHETELVQKVQDYKQYFVDMYYTWEDWRKEFIHITSHPESPVSSFPCFVKDSYHDLSIYYMYPHSTDEVMLKDETKLNKYKELCNQSKMCFLDEAKGIFLNMYSHTFVLDKFFPNNWGALSVAPNRTIGTFTYGIVGKNTLPNVKLYGTDYEENFKLCSDEPGIITGINIHHSDILNGLTVKYKGRPGTSIGDVKAGDATTIRGLNKDDRYITGVDIYFNNERVISGIQFYFKDNLVSEVFGSDKDSKIFCWWTY